MNQWLISIASAMVTTVTTIAFFKGFDLDTTNFWASYAVTLPLYVFYNTCLQISVYTWRKSK